MTKDEAKDKVINYALGLKVNDGINTMEELIDKIFDEHEAELRDKNEEIRRLKAYMEVNDNLHLFKLAFNETVKELIVKPLVENIASNIENPALFDAKVARMVHIIEYAVENGQVHTMAKTLIEKEEELQKLRRERDIAIIRGYSFE